LKKNQKFEKIKKSLLQNLKLQLCMRQKKASKNIYGNFANWEKNIWKIIFLSKCPMFNATKWKKELNVCASVFFLYDCWWFDLSALLRFLTKIAPRPLQKMDSKIEKLIIKQKRQKHKVFSKVQIIIFCLLHIAKNEWKNLNPKPLRPPTFTTTGHSVNIQVWKSRLKLEKLEVQIFHIRVRGFISDIYEVSTDSKTAGTH